MEKGNQSTFTYRTKAMNITRFTDIFISASFRRSTKSNHFGFEKITVAHLNDCINQIEFQMDDENNKTTQKKFKMKKMLIKEESKKINEVNTFVLLCATKIGIVCHQIIAIQHHAFNQLIQ